MIFDITLRANVEIKTTLKLIVGRSAAQPSWSTPHPAFAALRHLLPHGEKEEALHCHGQSPPIEIN